MSSISASGWCRAGEDHEQARGFEALLDHGDLDTTVVVRGDIDPSTCPRLWAVMEQAMLLSPRLVLDLAAATYVDAAGVGLILRAHRRLGQIKEALVIR